MPGLMLLVQVQLKPSFYNCSSHDSNISTSSSKVVEKFYTFCLGLIPEIQEVSLLGSAVLYFMCIPYPQCIMLRPSKTRRMYELDIR